MRISPAKSAGDPVIVAIDWGVRIPMRDNVSLHSTLYRPRICPEPLPGLITITPYVADSFHDAGVYFATQGFVFLSVDCRGRGNSDGNFVSYVDDGRDGHDVVEWLGRHPLCNGKVAMGGGSYSGFNQWATTMHAPPHLAAIMPRCASYPGLDFPIRNNIGEQYSLQWLAFTAGRTLQPNLFRDRRYWSALWQERFCEGRSYASLADEHPEITTQLSVWTQHPEPDSYWDHFTPDPAHYASLCVPALTVTGYYDDDQHGALAYYKAASDHGSPVLRNANYLVIGPWDHEGVGAPQATLDGVAFGADSVIDMRALSTQWYCWTMMDGARPPLLQDKVSYFVAGANRWRHAPSLEAVTREIMPLHLSSAGHQPRYLRPGRLTVCAPTAVGTDAYVYDPLDVTRAELEGDVLPYNISDVRLLEANDGNQLVYDSDPFERDTEVSGQFRFEAWLGINCPDTDFRVLIYLVQTDGTSILLSNDTKRARYRMGLRQARLLTSPDPMLYIFDSFWWTSRMVGAGERLRLVIGPYNSIYTQKNYNSGKPVAFETCADARAVTVTLATGGENPSILYVPLAADANG